MDNQEKKMPWQKETIDEFIEKAGQKKSRLVSFTSAWKCNFVVVNNTKEVAALLIYVKTADIARTNMNGGRRNSESALKQISKCGTSGRY